VKKIDRGNEYKNFVQQIPAGQCLTFTLKIDELLFREREKQQLQFNNLQEEILRSINKVCSALASDILATELEFFDIYDLDRIASLYIKLEDLNNDLPENTFLLQIGWGTGYHANTVTGVFANSHDPPRERWLEIQKRFKLGESRSRRGHYDEREFPKTRRILYQGHNPIAPLGWVKISPVED
jgi:CRISPR type III-A-associated RAMP protein Csm5